MARPPKNPLIPTRNGVSPSCVALPLLPADDRRWPTLLDFLAERLPAVDRGAWQQRLSGGQVLDDHAQPVRADDAYRGGGRLYYWRALDDEPEIPFEATLRFQDAHLLVVDKPHFLPVTPTGRFVRQSLLVRLKQATGIDTLSPIHRIDRETAGLVVFSVRPQDRGAYQALFRERSVDKVYEAIAPFDSVLPLPRVHRSRMAEDPDAFYRMTEIEGEPNSETAIALLERRGAWARYRLEPVTGKRHQLRVHMAALGLPLAGDQFYPRVRRGPGEPEDFADPLRLLARGIGFTDPVTGERRRFESGLSLDWPSPD
ncbi:pseudouridine synthase [Hydrogenophaga flava]|uniref:pseudouridine synthase n=1 Tax=Hydrogenophaga flava TaxID=65657 RepID=UPI0008249305|nr:pseudouridine synthase [Hydrogenophaga flava]